MLCSKFGDILLLLWQNGWSFICWINHQISHFHCQPFANTNKFQVTTIASIDQAIERERERETDKKNLEIFIVPRNKCAPNTRQFRCLNRIGIGWCDWEQQFHAPGIRHQILKSDRHWFCSCVLSLRPAAIEPTVWERLCALNGRWTNDWDYFANANSSMIPLKFMMRFQFIWVHWRKSI